MKRRNWGAGPSSAGTSPVSLPGLRGQRVVEVAFPFVILGEDSLGRSWGEFSPAGAQVGGAGSL